MTPMNDGRRMLATMLNLFCILTCLLHLVIPGNALQLAKATPHRHGTLLANNMVSDPLMTMSITENPRQLVAEGMKAFRKGDVQGSIRLFDRAELADASLRPFLWQRGISYYYDGQFQAGSDQFRFDVRVNPLDVEEIVWDIACLSRLKPEVVPPSTMMALPTGKTDRRKIMATVYSLFRGEANEHDLAVAGHQGSAADEFYSDFYLGLYCESRGETGKAANYMKSAIATKYATEFGAMDYMTSVARVHCHLRGWD
jgi:hypothetical protein